MKIIIKSLKQVAYELELNSDDLSIKDLKSEIEKKHGFEAESIKILFKGSMLDDKKQIKDYKIAEGDTLTMMSSKVKPQNLNKNPESKIKEESKENKLNANNNDNNNKNDDNNKNKDISTIQKSTSTTQNLVSGLINSLNSSKQPEKDYSSEAQQLVEMGFNFPEALSAVKAAKGNLDRAVDYLYNGIPENQQGQNLQNIPLIEEFLDPEEAEYEEGEEGDYNNEIPLTFEVDPHMLDSLDLKDPNSLKTIASFVKVLISEDPSSLQNLLEDIEETNPEIIEFIKEHEDEFKQLISVPLEDEDLKKFLPIGNTAESSNANTNNNNAENNDNNKNIKENQVINENKENKNAENAENNQETQMQGHNAGFDVVGLKSGFTQEEKESVERLKVLGFSEEEVCQAFLVCEKNEMMTANFLLENKFKDPNSMDVDGNFLSIKIFNIFIIIKNIINLEKSFKYLLKIIFPFINFIIFII